MFYSEELGLMKLSLCSSWNHFSIKYQAFLISEDVFLLKIISPLARGAIHLIPLLFHHSQEIANFMSHFHGRIRTSRKNNASSNVYLRERWSIGIPYPLLLSPHTTSLSWLSPHLTLSCTFGWPWPSRSIK